ncbi:ATP-binding cassette domain-containing protein [Mesorhizobium sp. VK24D]|uniref:ATP-binding cassette domain-containing protein n=1 Tax=Mesorhizobium album TaxID=3072314 RepID=A0ABU4XT96_9HYPH|nr:ATP-binding cassette domain-containing protein [Mesorhizobium sp. VK24D]MDX8477927.1 ATP-binding cassette domain-containing protein [Mesorhizobium sp. VK24D]
MIIDATRLGRRLGRTRALADLSFTVAEGELFGVVGPDGAGKTTLLQMLSAILDPTEGSCRVLGFDSVREAHKIVSAIGYMPQGFSLYQRLTVDENLEFAASIRNVPAAAWGERRERLLAMTGLAPFSDRQAGRLSGGMKKKLALCANLVHQPPLLLLDEPSLGVDPVSRREFWKLLEEFRRAGTTIVVATSYMDEADRCDRVLFLERGRSLAVGTPAELRAGASADVYEISGADLAGAEAKLRALPALRSLKRLPDRLRAVVARTEPGSGIEIPSFSRVPPSLEDVFAMLERENGAQTSPVGITPIRTPAKTAIRAEGVTCRFGSFTAVDNVSLSIDAGEIFGFLGPNGAGKTTFIRVLCGLQEPLAGRVEVAGIDVRRKPRALRPYIGYVSQLFSLYPDLTVGENLAFFAGVYGLKGSARADAIEWAVSMAGLDGLDAVLLRDASGAIRQRVALACSVMHRPPVLFLDEPTSGVDPVSRHRFWELIRALAKAGVTVFVTTHYLEEAGYCDRLGMMLAGRLIGLGTLAELRAGLPEGTAANPEEIFLAYVEREQKKQERVAP